MIINARSMKRIVAGLAVMAAFAGGVAWAGVKEEKMHATSIVNSTSLIPYTNDAARTMLDYWLGQGIVTGRESAVAKQALLTSKSRTAMKEVMVGVLVENFDEATLRSVAAFFRTRAGKAWAASYEDTMQRGTNVFCLAMLGGIKEARSGR